MRRLVLFPALFLAATVTVLGADLWSTTGSRDGTAMIQVDNIKLNLPSPPNLIVFAGKLYFAADDGEHGVELWSTTGDGNGTEMVLDINTEKDADDKDRKRTNSSNPSNLMVYAGKLYFTADDAVNGVQLWSTTGSENGTEMVRLIGKGPRGANVGNLTVFNGKLYFTADDGIHGMELWSTTGSRDGTEMVQDLNEVKVNPENKKSNRTRSSNPANLTVFQNKLYFAADDGIHGAELWSTTGDKNGIEMVLDTNTEKDADDKDRKRTNSSNPSNLTVYAGKLYFTADDAVNGVQLWSTTGSENGTEMVRLIGKGPGGAKPAELIRFNAQLYFTANDGVHGIELWRTTGARDGTEMVLDLNKVKADPKNKKSNRTLSADPSNLTVFNGKLYFSADDGIHGVELWSTTGSENGTEMVLDINTEKDADDKDRKRTLSASPTNLTVFRDKLYFVADDAVNGDQLWSTTGSENGTEMVRLIGKGPRGADPEGLTIFGGKLYFSVRRR